MSKCKCHSCGQDVNTDKDNYYYSVEDPSSVYCTICGSYMEDVRFNNTQVLNSLDDVDMEIQREHDLGVMTQDEKKDYIEAEIDYEEGFLEPFMSLSFLKE